MTRCLAVVLLLLVSSCHPKKGTESATETGAPAWPEPAATRCRAGDGSLQPVDVTATGSPVALARRGEATLAFVAAREARTLLVVDVDAEREIARMPMAAEQLLVTSDGRLLVASAETHRVEVLHLRGEVLERGCSVAVPAEPVALAATADFARVVVASRWGSALTILDGKQLTALRSVPLARDPAAVTLSADQRRAVVAHAVGGRVSLVSLADGSVSPVAIERSEWRSDFSTMKYSDGHQVGTVRVDRTGQQGFSVARAADGRVMLPLTLVATARRGLVGYGTGKTTLGAQATVDPSTGEVELSAGERNLTEDCLLPRGAAHDAQRGVLWVVCRGDDSLIGFRDDRFAREVARVRIGGGPRGVALDPARARLVTWSEFAQQLWVASLPDGMGRDGTEVAAKAIAIEGLATLAPQLALGRRLFHLAGATRRLASDGRACASCHPDGRDDGLTWATSEGPRQTPVLSARLGDAAPFGWDGANDTLDTHLVRTLRRLSGTGLEPHEREAILAYVQSMRAPMVDPSGDAAFVEGGAAVFAEMGCASCHPKGGSDGLAHDIGSRSQHDPTLRYDTPSLRFVARSAPYFHDGRYPTIEALLSDASSGMGDSARLSEPDRRALAAYLRSL